MSDAPVLEYAKGRSPWRRRVVRGILAMVVVAVVFAGWYWRRDISQHVAVWHWQRQCAKFSLPVGEIMLESDPAGAAKLLADRPHDYWKFVHVHHPGGGAERGIPAVDNLLGVLGHMPASVPRSRTVFVHELTAAGPGSKPRLVIVEIDDTRFVDTPGLDVRVLSKGNLLRLPVDVSRGTSASIGLHFENQPDPLLRVYAGQADPSDGSHFTIDYEEWGQRDTFDGWLQADDTVKFKRRKWPEPPPVIRLR